MRELKRRLPVFRTLDKMKSSSVHSLHEDTRSSPGFVNDSASISMGHANRCSCALSRPLPALRLPVVRRDDLGYVV